MVAENIKSYLKEKGIMYAAVADKAGIRRDSFSNSMNGKRGLKLDEYCKICMVLNVPLGTFVDDAHRTRPRRMQRGRER